MLSIGIKGTTNVVVCKDNTAEKMGSGELPVFATPSMIALMEECAYKSVKVFLEDNQGTVGTLMNVKHVSASPLDMKITAESELIEIDKKRLVFTVKAYDELGLIGEGVHERFIIDNDRFMNKVNTKRSK